jgi:N-acetylglutamate synthase-like GNAT family acetyltransferase
LTEVKLASSDCLMRRFSEQARHTHIENQNVMTTPSFTPADPVVHRDVLIGINIEYVSWVLGEVERSFGVTPRELLGMSIPEYVPSAIDKVCGDPPPRGVFYLIHVDGKLAGMCGLRFIRTGVAEIKRVYVRPAYRGMSLGQSALHRLLSDAKEFGYQSICLDTAPFMQSAQRMYEAHGFIDCAAYAESEVPSALHSVWRFMERAVSATGPALVR